MLQISTNTLKTRKKVEIDGHPYIVRRYGAGEQLALNQILREAGKLEKKLTTGEATEEEIVQAEDLSKRMMDIFTGLFEDGVGGEKSRALVQSLNQVEVQELFRQIFEDSDGSVEIS